MNGELSPHSISFLCQDFRYIKLTFENLGFVKIFGFFGFFLRLRPNARTIWHTHKYLLFFLQKYAYIVGK